MALSFFYTRRGGVIKARFFIEVLDEQSIRRGLCNRILGLRAVE